MKSGMPITQAKRLQFPILAQVCVKTFWLQKLSKTELKTAFIHKILLELPAYKFQILRRRAHFSFWSGFSHSLRS